MSENVYQIFITALSVKDGSVSGHSRITVRFDGDRLPFPVERASTSRNVEFVPKVMMSKKEL